MLPVANYSMRLYDAAYYYFRVCIATSYALVLRILKTAAQ